MIRHTEGTVMSSPPGPVTSHLLRWLLFFKMASLPLQITFCKENVFTSDRTTQQQPANDTRLFLWKLVSNLLPAIAVTTASRRRTHLVLDEVTQSFDDDGAAALLFGVSGFQPHDVLGVCH